VVETIHETLRSARESLDNGATAVEKLVITKQLTKSPEEYPDAANQAHVQVALRRAAQGKREGVAAGETVPYVICRSAADGGEGKATGKGLAARAYHPEEVRCITSERLVHRGWPAEASAAWDSPQRSTWAESRQ
jgi:DNA polymerase alpha subunit A